MNMFIIYEICNQNSSPHHKYYPPRPNKNKLTILTATIAVDKWQVTPNLFAKCLLCLLALFLLLLLVFNCL